MFIGNLNDRQQSVLLHYADAIMRADNRIDSSELLLMNTLREQSHEGVRPEAVPIDRIADIFTTRIGRVSFLLELVGVACVNDDLDPRQSELINQIAGSLGMMEDGTLDAIRQWVIRQLDLTKEARDLMQEK